MNIIKTKKYKTIGILGGMGPAASARLYQTIITLTQLKYQASQDTDYPPMIIYNLPLFGFDETGIVDNALVLNQLISGVQKLEKSGCDFIIIACNTVHYYYNEMCQAVKIPIINLIETASKQVWSKGYSIVGVLSSESTNKLGLYHESLHHFNIHLIDTNPVEQETINNIILHVMSGNSSTIDTLNLVKIINHLTVQGAQGIILGCTEIPLAIKQDDIDVPLINPVEIISYKSLELALGF